MPERNIVRILLTLMVLGTTNSVNADEVLRDPTRPYRVTATQSREAPRFTVNAIFISDQRRIAIVNGQRVAIGGHVGGATVIAINKDQLILNIDGKRITARLSR